MFNQEFFSICGEKFLGTASDTNTKLHSDIRVSAKHNSFYIERFENQKVTSRIIYTQYHTLDERNFDCLGDQAEPATYRPTTNFLLIVQKLDSIALYSKELTKYFYNSDIATTDSIWDFANDEPNNDIFNVLVDTMQKGKLDIYVVFANCLMKKFSSPVQD